LNWRVVYGIEGNNFSAGTAISLFVQQAVNKIIKQIVKEMQ
jgi:hypothetical protein